MTKDLINKIEEYTNYIDKIPKKDQETFKNLYETLINVLKKTNSMSGGAPRKCQRCILDQDGKCIVCKKKPGQRARRSSSRRRLNTKLGKMGKRIGATESLIQGAQQLAEDLDESVPGDSEGLYQLAQRIFGQATNELRQRSNFQNKDRELWFYNLYLYVIIPFSCLLCTSVQGYLWYDFISTFIWIIEENTAAVEYQSGVEAHRTEALSQESISHAFRTGVENFRLANAAEQQQQRITWLQTIRNYLPGATDTQIATIEAETVAPPPAPETSSRSFRQWGHEVTHSMKNWFINKNHDVQNNFVVQLMAQFGHLARSTGNFIYIFPLVSSIYVIKKHIDWARRVMKEHPTYIEIGDPPRKGPRKDPRDPKGDGSGSSTGSSTIITTGGKRRRRTRKKRGGDKWESARKQEKKKYCKKYYKGKYGINKKRCKKDPMCKYVDMGSGGEWCYTKKKKYKKKKRKTRRKKRKTKRRR